MSAFIAKMPGPLGLLRPGATAGLRAKTGRVPV